MLVAFWNGFFPSVASGKEGVKADTQCSGIVLEKVAEYFYFNMINRDRANVKDMEIPPELCLELLMAADYLDSKFFSNSFSCAAWLTTTIA